MKTLRKIKNTYLFPFLTIYPKTNWAEKIKLLYSKLSNNLHVDKISEKRIRETFLGVSQPPTPIVLFITRSIDFCPTRSQTVIRQWIDRGLTAGRPIIIYLFLSPLDNSYFVPRSFPVHYSGASSQHLNKGVPLRNAIPLSRASWINSSWIGWWIDRTIRSSRKIVPLGTK